VDGINVDGKKFVVATGSSPRIPSIPGIERVDYLTNVEALSLRNKPASMVVLVVEPGPRVRPDVRAHGNQSDSPAEKR